MTLMLQEDQVSEVLAMSEVIQAIEHGFRELANNNVVMPPRAGVRISDRQTLLNMPAYVGGRVGALGTKIVTVFDSNPELYGQPAVQALILMLDPRTGAPCALLGGTSITAYRTGAVSAVATKYLARENSSVVGLIGSGAQAITQLLGVCAVRKIEQVKVHSRNRNRVESFISKAARIVESNLGLADTARSAVEDSDIVITATNSTTPVFQCEWLVKGTHVNAVGSFKPDMRELDERTVKIAKLVVDSKSACLAEAGEIAIPIAQGTIRPEDIYAELAEIVMGQKPGRTSDEEITVFKSVGLAFEDVVTAKMVMEKLSLESK